MPHRRSQLGRNSFRSTDSRYAAITAIVKDAWITAALQILAEDDTRRIDPADTAAILEHESSGDPYAINLWDSDPAAGHPRKTCRQTFQGRRNYAMSTALHRAIAGHVNRVVTCRTTIASSGYRPLRIPDNHTDTAQMSARYIGFGPDGFEFGPVLTAPSRAARSAVASARRYLAGHPRQRRTLVVLITLFVFLVFPGLVGAIAFAAGGNAASSTIDGLAWTNVRDSSGLPLANYAFITNNGSLFHPERTFMALLLDLEFMGYIVIVTFAIWLIGYALSFQWLDWIAQPLTSVADNLTTQISTPILLTTAATLGAFFVAWFVVRGHPAKAMAQILTMITVAILGPFYLSEPLGEVLSSHGLLSQGRNVGLSVAAGLHGDQHHSSRVMLPVLQKNMADNLVRHPLQVWNFGHVLDERGNCGAVWNNGLSGGTSDELKDNLRRCGDIVAAANADTPDIGQVCTGLLLLLTSTVLLVFAVYFAIKVIWAALDSIYHGMMAVFGFAAGGFVYGPTQTFLVRNLVDGVIAAARMAVYTIFLGVYMLFLDGLFDSAKDNLMAVFVITACIEIIAVLQLRRLSHAMSQGNDWLANRFAQSIEGQPATGGAGRALGMGTAGAGNSLGLLTGLTALSTLNASPLSAWLLGKNINPLNPNARVRNRAEKKIMSLNASDLPYAVQREQAAIRAHADYVGNKFGAKYGLDTALGLADAYDMLGITPNINRVAVFDRLGVSQDRLTEMEVVVAASKMSNPNPYEFAPHANAREAADMASKAYQEGKPHAEAQAAWAVMMAGSYASKAPIPGPRAHLNTDLIERAEKAWSVEDGNIPKLLNEEFANGEFETAGKDTLAKIGHNMALETRERAWKWYRYAFRTPAEKVNKDTADRYLQEYLDMFKQSNEFENMTDPLAHDDPWPGIRHQSVGNRRRSDDDQSEPPPQDPGMESPLPWAR